MHGGVVCFIGAEEREEQIGRGVLIGVYQILWPRMFAVCNLNREMKEMLSSAGKWDVDDLVGVREEEHWGKSVKSRE